MGHLGFGVIDGRYLVNLVAFDRILWIVEAKGKSNCYLDVDRLTLGLAMSGERRWSCSGDDSLRFSSIDITGFCILVTTPVQTRLPLTFSAIRHASLFEVRTRNLE
jgi:hypothetical protein